MLLGSFGENLCLVEWSSSEKSEKVKQSLCTRLKADFCMGSSPIIEAAIQSLTEYFEGKRRDFELPLLFVGTDFQKKVWRELMRIPYGTTVTYASLARRIGNPLAVRAVANACANNTIAIIAPCHRVIGSGKNNLNNPGSSLSNNLTGYAGGLPLKSALFSLERK